MFHDVREKSQSFYPERYNLSSFLSQVEFEKCINNLSLNHYFLCPSSNYFNDTSQLDESRAEALLTFDDGLKDHVLNVLPVLIKNEIKAIFFIPSEAILSGKVIHSHKIQFIYAATKNKSQLVDQALQLVVDQMTTSLPRKVMADRLVKLYSRSQIKSSVWTQEQILFTRLLREVGDYNLRDKVLTELFCQHVSDKEIEFSENFYMSLEDLKYLLNCGMTIGGHGHFSINSVFETESKQKLEVDLSYDFLKNKVFDNNPFNFYYSYPNGGVTNAGLKQLSRHKCAAAFTTIRKPYNTKNDKLQIPRYDGTKDIF